MGNTLNDPVYRHDYLPKNGTELPPAWHQAYFPPRVTEQELSADGYEQDWKPPSPFTHRMWAGGELEWNVDNPLRVGDRVEMVSSLRDIQFRPAGRRGDSVFIWIDKKISNQKGWAMTETRSWVYVQPTSSSPDKNGSSSSKKTQAIFELPHHDFSFEITPTPITLFRFSALTFNSHLIHYDHQYATETEHHRVIQSFKYRCRSPLVVNEAIRVQGKADPDTPGQYSLWVADAQGNMAVKGTATVATTS
ncbi:hydroxyacyl-thioester dehydratase typemitochondrial [Lichtheimia corymbifera JMRC:FSU:9682]|uniref:Hydroxyacyl-thioester dehydratase typemitochondrial n=1 Tax=Lichtheimia corymbifera JMRC:FSU:9682 TaxID=1263082 RepID=A0A068RX15_9FUNG|nr:hydroxyacyl-thioester dehydratase typemitochondrial [Lichtheimia corymbifera JMRC:FSU:9682]